MLQRYPAAIAAALLLAPATAQADAFDDTLAAHFGAVKARDLPTLEKTITTGERLELYLPNGTRTDTRQAFVDFHREWFKSSGWTMQFNPVSINRGKDIAQATVRTLYQDTVDGKPYRSESWLTLTFRKEAGDWRLIHDQNTRIPQQP